MVYYPLSTLMLAGIREILVIDAPGSRGLPPASATAASSGWPSSTRCNPAPTAWPRHSVIGRDFIGRAVALALGDNIFYGHGLPDDLRRAAARDKGGTVFAYWVRDPERYGVVEFDAGGRAVSLEEKPAPLALPGGALLLRQRRRGDRRRPQALGPRRAGDHGCRSRLPACGDAARGEAGARHRLARHRHPRGPAPASSFIQTIEEQGLMVACVEEIAYIMGYITATTSAGSPSPCATIPMVSISCGWSRVRGRMAAMEFSPDAGLAAVLLSDAAHRRREHREPRPSPRRRRLTDGAGAAQRGPPGRTRGLHRPPDQLQRGGPRGHQPSLHARQTDVWFVPPSDRMLLVLSTCARARPPRARRLMLGDGASRLVVIPPGVAHGVQSSSATGCLVYFVDVQFTPEPALRRGPAALGFPGRRRLGDDPRLGGCGCSSPAGPGCRLELRPACRDRIPTTQSSTSTS